MVDAGLQLKDSHFRPFPRHGQSFDLNDRTRDSREAGPTQPLVQVYFTSTKWPDPHNQSSIHDPAGSKAC